MDKTMKVEQLADLTKSWGENGQNADDKHKLAVSILEIAEGQLLSSGDFGSDFHVLHDYLNITGRTDFLRALKDRDLRYRWARTAACAIETGNYSLLDLFNNRVKLDPGKTLFCDMSGSEPSNWSYRVTDQRTKSLAAGLLKINKEPRVAIVSNNCVESAFADLACLFYNILVTPLNVHFDSKTLAYIFNKLGINIVLTDTAEHRDKLLEARKMIDCSFEIYALLSDAGKSKTVKNIFRDVCINLSKDEIDSYIKGHPRQKINRVNTVMFTSGSTGMPKGISFSEYNLVTKRFARAAALPEVGDNEVLLCYLPLYHTFGRYLELLGAIYWGGTYVFQGNTSSETFLDLLPKVKPTGLIGVPFRWQLIQERCLARMESVLSADKKREELHKVTGNRLRWGLSAAGYLAPSVFRFFNKNGIYLCSGFGMTEATGGITMTPPGEYRDNSIGTPLPLVDTRLTEKGELEISGDYIAHYLEDKKPGDEIPITHNADNRYWLSTGDLFKILPDGHYQIIDRLKDIYKNSKGQTIAPQQVEKKFEGVPGIKRTFLVGDARDFNVLLIVPDFEDPVLKNLNDESEEREYFHQIVSSANKDLAAYERVINFAVLDRDFSVDKNELTPKGSLKRKEIENNFRETIDSLYVSKFVELNFGDWDIIIPRWFYRDLGILEDSIEVTEKGLIDINDSIELTIKETYKDNNIQVGDFIYEIKDKVIDFGVLVRKPLLWAGNPSLMEFYPCKIGWDTSIGSFTEHISLPYGIHDSDKCPPVSGVEVTSNISLSIVNNLIICALFGEGDSAEKAINLLASKIKETDERIAGLIRKRLVMLANHPEFNIRSLAYRVLLLDEPTLNYGKALPAFIESGLPFLDEDSIAKIAQSDLNISRLRDLRRRLFNYRNEMSWPVSDTIRKQFDHILRLLVSFVRLHPEYYDTVRCELASWVLHKDDPKLSSSARTYLDEVIDHYETNLANNTMAYMEKEWQRKIIFGDELNPDEKKRLMEVLKQPTFLKQSVMLAFDQESFDLSDVRDEGIWVSRITSRRHYLRYRVSINTVSNKHFDFQVILNDDIKNTKVMETIYWLLAISKHPYESEVLPRLGCCRPELGARTLVYYGQLTVWEKIREYSERRRNSSSLANQAAWRKLFVRGMTAIFKAWKISGKRIIPGAINPENLVVPYQDFVERATILSLTGWRNYEDPVSLIGPIVQQLYRRTIAHYPWCRFLIDIDWIFDACLEELGVEAGKRFLNELLENLETNEIIYNDIPLKTSLEEYIEKLQKEMYLPLPLRNAISRYYQWAEMNPLATSKAREQIIQELWRLYRLDRYPEIVRYYLYYKTYFSSSSNETKEAFSKLLNRMYTESSKSARQLIELSELQATLTDEDDRALFGKIIFPEAKEEKQLEVIAVGDSEHKQVMVKTIIEDNHNEKYYITEPKQPAEIGQLYRLFMKQGYHKTISEKDKFLLVFDSQDQIVGGLCYRYDGEDIVHLDGSIVATSLIGNGLGSALLEDFCTRMKEQGIRLIKTHFYLRKFYTKRGFKIDSRWGALVRFLDN